MANENNQKRSINRFFLFANIFPFAFFILLVIGVAILASVYVSTQAVGALIGMIVFAVLMAAGYLAVVVYYYKKFNAIFVRGLYSITVYNLRNITDNENALIDYPNNSYDEFISLNETVNTLKTELDTSTLIAGTSDYSRSNLDYIDVDRNVVSLRSFRANLDSIIFNSQNYRNVLIELYYDLNEDTLSEQDLEYLIVLLHKNFGDYRQSLIIENENEKSLLLYLPRIDSMSKIREQLENTLRSATINKRTPEGITNLVAHFALVCYPFSDVKEMFSDLAYAKRQDELINIYLPNRMVTMRDNKILKNSMNLNTMSKILAPLLNLNLSLENNQKNRSIVENVIRNIRQYFDVDYAGIISFDEVKGKYYFSYQVNNNDVPILSRDNFIEKEFVYAMNKAKDENNSYYFAYRSHANSALGRHLDRVGLESGLFYVLNDGDLCLGAIYFFNKNKDLRFDSYIQEALVVLCDKIAAILLGERRDEEVNNSYTEIESLLKLSEFATYRVAQDDYTLIKKSSTFSGLFPRAVLGEKCYKALYGLDKPCKDCPLLTGNKKVSELANSHYETSLVLANRGATYKVMTLRNIGKEDSEQRYNPDLLVNSYSSLLETLNNNYLINGKGYLLLLRIDNMSDLVEKNGTEGYFSIIRDFIQQLKKRHNNLENIYFFNNQVLALLFTEYGQIDIVDECEEIFEITQNKHRKSETDFVINVTYLPIAYPRAYLTAQALLKQAEQFANRGKYETGKNFIYFDDSSYQRSASKDEFMLSVIESSFGNKTFGVLLQPMVDKNKRIIGGELLLRITDEYRNMVFRTDELVNVAAKHDQIGVISHALLDYISALYQQYANSIFKLMGMNRLSLNTDYSFFTDVNFYSDIEAFINNLRLPKDFLAFEIPESDVASHLNEFKDIAKHLNAMHIVLVCDQYSGRHVSVEALKDIGFNEVKISRGYVSHIDSDKARLNDVKNLLANIKELGLRASCVGVENIDQYLLLKEIDEDILMQGFYFHRPLEKQAFIEAVRGNNKFNKNK